MLIVNLSLKFVSAMHYCLLHWDPGGGALSIIVCYVCAAVKTPIFSPEYPFQSIMISEETEMFTLFPFRRPPNLPLHVPVHHECEIPRPEGFRKIRRRGRGAPDFALG